MYDLVFQIIDFLVQENLLRNFEKLYLDIRFVIKIA